MKAKRRIVMAWMIGAALALSASSADAGAPHAIAGAVTVDADQVISMVVDGDGVHLIDARTPKDYDAAHIEGAVMLTDDTMTEESLLEVVGAHDASVIFYCNGANCGRAANATTKAVGWGFSNVYYYFGGIEDWKSLELPLVEQ